MRIGLLTACYHPVTNGVTRMVSLYASAYRKMGHDVAIFTVGEKNSPVVDPQVYRSPGLPLGRTGYYFTRGYTAEAQAALAEMDILHAHHLAQALEFGRRYGRAPLVYTNHTRYDLYAEVYTPLRPRWLARKIGRWLAHWLWARRANLADAIIAPTEAIARTMRNFGVEKPITVIPNGIDLAPFRHPADPFLKQDFGWEVGSPTAVYVGRLAEEKNLGHLLQQVALARQTAEKLRLLIVGDGPQREELEALARTLRFGQAIHFTGEVANDEISNYLAAADFFVTASLSEVDPLTVIEALAAGLPVAACQADWVADSLGTDKGAVTAPPESFSDLLLSLACDRDLRHRLSAAGRRSSQERAIETTAAATLDLYRTLQIGSETRDARSA